MSEIDKKVQELDERLTEYEKSGFWSRRDVIKGLGAGLLGLGGAAALMQPASAGSFLADMNASNPQVKINNVALVKTTAGQTINVSTAAELTTALANLAAAPSLLGDVIIQLTNNITSDISIPSLLYNGFSLTIQGTLQTDVSFTNATTTAANPGGGVYGTITIAGTPWVADTYQGKIAYTPLGKACVIKGNTNNTLYHAANSGLDVGVGACTIKSCQYTLTGKITMLADSRLTLKYLRVYNNIADYVLLLKSNANLILIESQIEQAGNAYLIYPEADNYISVQHSVLKSVWSDMFAAPGKTYIDSVYKPSGFISTGATGGRLFNFAFLSTAYMREGFAIQTVAKTANNTRCVYSNIGCCPYFLLFFIDNFDVGLNATMASFIISSACAVLNCTTNKTPAAASDPSYIL